MARLVAVCRDSEEEFLFERLQIPLYIDDTLTVSEPWATSLSAGGTGGGLATRHKRVFCNP
uniref:Uncharacterized protein n=1 Tax=Naja naja TaxID=35670 RepID=A0A8C6XWU2_NAJNA